MNTQELQARLQRHLSYLEQDSNNSSILLAISAYYRDLGHIELARKYLEDAEKISGEPFTYESGILKARLLHHLEQSAEAIVLLEALIVHYPYDADIAGFLGLLHLDANDVEQAEQLSNKALTLNAAHAEGQLVQILLKTLRGNVTVAEIESLLQLMPLESRLWYALGATHLRLMNVLAAEQAFAKATEIWPDFYDSWITMGWCYVLQNKLDKAAMAYQRVANSTADNANAWGGLALVSALQNNSTAATKWLEQARLLDQDCFLINITAMIMANQVNADEAIIHFNATFPAIKLAKT